MKLKCYNSEILVLAMTIVIVILSYWFWAWPYRAALAYREEMQLFLTTGGYLSSHLNVPGGLAVYIGEFLTQFFNNYWMGGGVMALLNVLLYLAAYGICSRKRDGGNRVIAAVAAVLPVIGMWLYMGDPNVTLGFLVGMLMVMGRTFIEKDRLSWWSMMTGTSALYWLAGPAAVVYTLMCVYFAVSDREMTNVRKSAFAIVSVAWMGVNAVCWSGVPYTLSYQLIGIGYNIVPDTYSWGLTAVEALILLTPIVAAAVSRRRAAVIIPLLSLAAVASAVVIYPKMYDRMAYDLINYDYMVRTNDWDGILEYSDRHEPELPMSVSATNLALGMKGQLDSSVFSYYQHGAEGLVPPFTKETLSSWTTGEIFYQLGMVNSAQRFYFEGMEAIPNYNKSGRALKRLAETAMVRGEYGVARKYLRLLEHTLFYRKWARRNLELISAPGGVAGHPVYGKMRAGMVDEDYMFSEGELDKTFGQLFLKDPTNNLAKQYLVVWPLLQRDLDKFVQYMGVVAEKYPQYNPLLAQQAMAFIAMKSRQPVPSQIVPQAVEQQLRQFAQAWTSKDPGRIETFRKTLYHYLVSGSAAR